MQRLLGRCMIHLQQYEKLLKAILRSSSVVTNLSIGQPPDVVWRNESEGSTLGILVKNFLEEMIPRSVESDFDSGSGEDAAPLCVSFSTDFRFVMETDRRASVEYGLRELVKVRNGLVHSFIDQFDIGSVEGCLAAADSLRQTFELIDAKFLELRGYAESLDQMRRACGEFIQPRRFQDIFDGIRPDGKVDWPSAGIVAALREAAEQLGGREWTPLSEAVEWILEKYPEQTPGRYGCRTWRQVVQESKAFKIKREPNETGQRHHYYGNR